MPTKTATKKPAKKRRAADATTVTTETTTATTTAPATAINGAPSRYTIILAIIGLASLITTTAGGAFISLLNFRLQTHAVVDRKAVAATLKQNTELIKENADAVADKLEDIEDTSDKTHALVNSGHGLVLKTNAELSRWKANQTKNPKDVEAADKAEKVLADHDKKQSAVDSKEATEETTKRAPPTRPAR